MDFHAFKRLTYTEVNSSLASQCEINFSKQAIAKVSDQIAELWSDRAEQHREALHEVEKADIPVQLQSDHKLYMLNDLIESVKLLPEVDGGNHEKYNLKREELLNRVGRLEKLKRKKELMQKFKEFVQLKIGGRIDVQKVIRPHNRELRDEIAKLRIMLEKLNTLDGEGRKKLKKLLNDGVLNKKC
jgi:very-short-patch-repair endonuclease